MADLQATLDSLGSLSSEDGDLDDILNLVLPDPQAGPSYSMFIDAVTVFAGRRVDQAMRVWKAMHKEASAVITGFQDLQELSLVSDVDGALWVHDMLKALACMR